MRRLIAAVRRPHSWSTWVLVGALVAGLVLRFVAMGSSVHLLDDDQAIVYLMAKRVSAGEWPLYYWGQGYGGALLPLLAGVVFLVVGPSTVALAVTGMVTWLIAALVIRQVALAIGGLVQANLAAVLFWLPGAVLLRLSMLDPGFYGPSIAVGVGAILVVVVREGPLSLRRWIVLGLLVGMGVWLSPTAAAPAIVAAVWAFARGLAVRRWIVFAATAMVGSAPFWIFNAFHEFAALRLYFATTTGSGVPFLDLLVRLRGLVFTILPASLYPDPRALAGSWWWRWSPTPEAAIVGAAPPLWFCIGVGILALGLVALVVIGAVRVRARRQWVFYSAGLATALILGLSLPGVSAAESRYAAFVLPFLVVALAGVLARFRALTAIVAATALVLSAVPTVASYDLMPRDRSGEYGVGLSDVADYLADRGFDHVYADYWIAYRLTALTDERVTAAALTPRRFEPYERLAAGEPQTVIVLFPGLVNDGVFSAMDEFKDSERVMVGGYLILIAPTNVDPYSVPLGPL